MLAEFTCVSAEGWHGGNSCEAADLTNHIAAAAKLIKETGYHRRDAELAELQQLLNKQ